MYSGPTQIMSVLGTPLKQFGRLAGEEVFTGTAACPRPYRGMVRRISTPLNKADKRAFFLQRKAGTRIWSLPASASGAGSWLQMPAAWLLSAGIFLMGAALAALALSAIPLLLELRQTAKRMQSLANTLEKEVPDTAATLRLTGLEMSDAIQEVSLLSLDLTNGLHASARLLEGAEKSLRQGTDFVMSTTAQSLLPAVRKQVPAAKGCLEGVLIRNRSLLHDGRNLLQLIKAAKLGAKRVRAALTTIQTLNAVSTLRPRASR